MPTKDAATPDHDWPGIRIQTIEIAPPPGIGIALIADIDPDQTTVTARLSAKISAEESQNALSDAGFEIAAFAMFMAFSCTVTAAVEEKIAV